MEVEVALMVLNQAAEAAYSVQAFDWSGGRCRGKERDRTQHVLSLGATADTKLKWYVVKTIQRSFITIFSHLMQSIELSKAHISGWAFQPTCASNQGLELVSLF